MSGPQLNVSRPPGSVHPVQTGWQHSGNNSAAHSQVGWLSLGLQPFLKSLLPSSGAEGGRGGSSGCISGLTGLPLGFVLGRRVLQAHPNMVSASLPTLLGHFLLQKMLGN